MRKWLPLLAFLLLVGCVQVRPGGQLEGQLELGEGDGLSTGYSGQNQTFTAYLYPFGTTKIYANCSNVSDYRQLKPAENQTWNLSLINVTNTNNTNPSYIKARLNQSIAYAFCIADLNSARNPGGENGTATSATNWTSAQGCISGAGCYGQGNRTRNTTASYQGNASFCLFNATDYVGESVVNGTNPYISWTQVVSVTNASNWSMTAWLKLGVTAGTASGTNLTTTVLSIRLTNSTNDYCGEVNATNSTGDSSFWTVSQDWFQVNVTNATFTNTACDGNVSNATITLRMYNQTGTACVDDVYLYREGPTLFNATSAPTNCVWLTSSWQILDLLESDDTNALYQNDWRRLSVFVNCTGFSNNYFKLQLNAIEK